jgi:hypothetical protein
LPFGELKIFCDTIIGMVEKHYGHLEPNYIADAIRAGAPKFGFRPDPTVTTLRR